MDRNSELVDFERGSTFGGLVTALVFTGFIYLIVYDLQENINNKPYTFEVRDKFMSPEEHMATKVNLGDFQTSQEFAIGFLTYFENGTQDVEFNPFDNDYIEVFSGFWDYEISQEKGLDPLYMHEGPELEICSRERMIQFLGAKMEYYRKNFICLKDKRETTIFSDHF